MKGVKSILKIERKQLILEKMSAEQVVSLEELVQLLKTSESTVRRDLDELEQEGKLRRVHGGAERLESLGQELSIPEKSIKNVQEKVVLAKKAVQFIKDGDIVFIDAGTSTGFLIEQLSFQSIINLTVITNSIHHAAQLVEHGIKTIVIGGYVKERTDASIGSFAMEQIKRLNFDKAFIGMNGVDKEYLTTPDPEEALIKKTVIANAKTTYVLADSSKIGQFAFVKVAELSQVTLVTNHSDKGILQVIRKKTKVIEV